MNSVLQDWVMELPLRQQGTILTGLRGCDLTPKFPLQSAEKRITAFLRYAVMNPFDPREIDSEPGCFMQSSIGDFKPSEMEHYPHHWVLHAVHALEVIAYKSPDGGIRRVARDAYYRFVKSMHLYPENELQMTERLNEDRILSGRVVME